MTTEQRKKVFLAAYKKTLGNISKAASQAKINRGTYYLWMEKDEAFAQACKDIDEAALDLAEAKLRTNIRRGYEKSIFFYLSTKGKHRGYVKEQNVNVKTTIVVALKARENKSSSGNPGPNQS